MYNHNYSKRQQYSSDSSSSYKISNYKLGIIIPYHHPTKEYKEIMKDMTLILNQKLKK